MEYTSVHWSITIGVNQGYDLENQVDVGLDTIATVYREAMEAIHEQTDVYISGVILPSRVVYSTRFGCPESGEIAYTIQGSRNPEFVDTESYLRALRLLIRELRSRLAQTTVMLEITPVHVEYYRE